MRGQKIGRRTLLAAAVLALAPCAGTAGLAQNAPDPGPGLDLTTAQRQLIYTSLSNQTHQSTAAPSTFTAAVGGTVPPAIELSPLPTTVVQVVPQVRGHAYAFIANQALLVEPKARRIVEIITRSGQ
jgi:hypothetical protein